VSQATKKAGEFQMRKQGGIMLTQTVAGAAKKAKPKPKPTEEKTEGGWEEGRKGCRDDDEGAVLAARKRARRGKER
jgi:hypothetical protein